MLVLEIPENSNCDAVEMRVFHDLEPPRAVVQVRLEREHGVPAWQAMIGWNMDGTTTAATARKVDDSGEGVVLLVTGGSAGLRLQSASADHAWRLDDAAQWGEPFLLIGDPHDLQLG